MLGHTSTCLSFETRMAFTLCACHVAHLYFVCNIFSFGDLMCVDLGWASDRDKAGYVAGYLQSANTLGRIPTATLWGCLADSKGERFAVLWTMFGIALGGICFGLSTSFWPSVMSRFVFMGLCNGWITMLGPLSSKVGGPEQQTRLLGYVLGTGQLVQLLAPAIGGWTYSRKVAWPALFPSIIGICLVAIASVVVWQWLPKREAGQVNNGDTRQARSQASGAATAWSWCSKVVASVQALRALQGFLLFALWDVVPLWAIATEKEGGLELTEDDLGVLLAASGWVSLVFAVFGMHRFIHRLGQRWAMAVSCVISVVAFLCIPWVTICRVKSVSIGAFLVFHSTGSAALMVTGAVALVFITNTVQPAQRGLANGVSATSEALAKGVAPTFSATSFAWCLDHFGSNGRAGVFIFLAVLQVGCMIVVLCLPAAVEQDIASCGDSSAREPMEPLADVCAS